MKRIPPRETRVTRPETDLRNDAPLYSPTSSSSIYSVDDFVHARLTKSQSDLDDAVDASHRRMSKALNDFDKAFSKPQDVSQSDKSPRTNTSRDIGLPAPSSSSAHPDDGWAQIEDLAERRRIQNRIAQRNYRKKLRDRLEDLERRSRSEEVDVEQFFSDDGTETQLLQKLQLMSAAWSSEDDRLLLIAHTLGLTWAEIRDYCFRSKTANACIERHEWLMERRDADSWDSSKMQMLAKEYMSMHEEIWSGLAARIGEDWRAIEEKCMSSSPESSQSTTYAAPVELTPITERVSRAQKGAPVHTYDVYQPSKTFTRAEHLRQHQLSHQLSEWSCTVSGCDKVFYRQDLLDRHLERHDVAGRIIKAYMSMRKEIWSGLAARIKEDWGVVEEKCMSTGLNSLHKTARTLELLAKKAKLAELKRAREIRMKQNPSMDQPIESLLMRTTDPLPPYLATQGMPEENTVAHYIHGKQPLKALHDDQVFIMQPPVHPTKELTPHPAGICEESTNLPGVNDKLPSKVLHSGGQVSGTRIQSPARIKPLSHMRLFSWIRKIFRPRLKPGYRRIEWTCDCGVELYGDFINDKATDLDGLGLSLHMPAENTSTNSSSDSEQSVETLTNPRHTISRSSSTRTALSTTSTDASSIDISQSKFLALCINTGGIYKTLAELDMSRINSDGEAFSQMKKAYVQYRGVRSRLRFLIKPVTVEFVRFTLWNLRRGYVSISDRPSSMPPNTRIDYDFVPPPMPPEVFVHYLEHGDGDLSPNRYTWLPRLPKRLNNKVLDCGEATEGWGIHIIEGPNRETVFWVLMITISASVIASVLWTTLRGDIQGGTGLGALIIALPPAIMAAFLFRLGAA